jgi:hypothetical protein
LPHVACLQHQREIRSRFICRLGTNARAKNVSIPTVTATTLQPVPRRSQSFIAALLQRKSLSPSSSSQGLIPEAMVKSNASALTDDHDLCITGRSSLDGSLGRHRAAWAEVWRAGANETPRST